MSLQLCWMNCNACELVHRKNVNKASAESHLAIGARHDGVVLGAERVLAWLPLGAALMQNNATSSSDLAAVKFDAQMLRVGVATVFR